MNKKNCSIGKSYKKKDRKEFWSWKKFKKNFSLTGGADWGTALSFFFDIKKILIIIAIVGAIYGVGYWKGLSDKPVKFNLDYEKAFHLKINHHYLYKPKNSSNLQIVDKNKNVIKTITANDIPELKEKLKPYGFQIKPIFLTGSGLGEDGIEGELGIGISFLKYFRGRLETFATNHGVYLGTSYILESDKFNIHNSAIGIGIGKGYNEGGNRTIIYWRWKF